MTPQLSTVEAKDRRILRDLAKRHLEIALSPVMDERRRLWYLHQSLKGERPMVVCETGGVMHEYLPESALECEAGWSRAMERSLRRTIYEFDHVGDDTVVDPFIRCNWAVEMSDYGLEVSYEHGVDAQGISLGYHWDPPMKNLDADLEKLHIRSFSVNREKTLRWKEHLEEVFAGIMPVQIRGSFWWTMGMTQTAIYLTGLDNMMLYMYDNPDGLHRLMALLRDDHLALLRWLENENLLTLNNANDYVGSGTYGFTHELPQPNWQPGDPVRSRDLWGLVESQETVGISPSMFGEFILPYQLEIAKQFGLTYYGCCEPVHGRWQYLQQISNLRSVSISPWCDQEYMADALGRKYVFSRKPNPALISTGTFDEDAIRHDLRETLRVARGCEVEVIMKDVHNLNGEPERMGRWVQIARETINEAW